jgi:hypothetical protein
MKGSLKYNLLFVYICWSEWKFQRWRSGLISHWMGVYWVTSSTRNVPLQIPLRVRCPALATFFVQYKNLE